MKKLLVLLAVAFFTTGCYLTIADPLGTYDYERNAYDYVLHVEADSNVSWYGTYGTIEGSRVSGYGRRTYQLRRLPACWDLQKTSSNGLLRVYVQRRGYSSYSAPRYNDQATYRAYQISYGCFR